MSEKPYKPVPDVECLKYHGTPDKPDIKIFVAHRIDLDSETIDNPLYIPVRCGAVYDEREGVTMLGDDTGENISDRKYSFGDLTVQYWAWKNVQADYYGICSYNQYLSFAINAMEESPEGMVLDPAFRQGVVKEKYLMTEDRIRALLGQYDILVAKKALISKLKTRPAFNKAKKASDILDIFEFTLATPKPSKLLEEIIVKDYPFLADSYKRYFSNSEILLGYAFIMKAEIYNDFCALEFEIIRKLEKKLKKQAYGELRVTAFQDIRNILLSVYVDYIQNKDNIKVSTLQLVNFESTVPSYEIFPAFPENNIAIMTMSSDEYAPYLGVYLKSILNTASPQHNYDILVFERNISERNKRLLKMICQDSANISLRFFNMNAKMAGVKFFVAAAHFAVEAYYRLLLPWTLPHYKKIIAMDCDIVVKKDLAELYKEDIDEVAMAAVKDYTYSAMLNGVFGADYELEYAKKTLKMKNPYNYINTGVLLLNLPYIRQSYTENYVVSFCQKKKFHFQEQDAMNVLLEGKIKFLDMRWNHTVSLNPNAVRAMENFCAESALQKIRSDSYILHFYAHPKPWFFPTSIFAEEWWALARETPFYEQLIAGMIDYRVGNIHYQMYEVKNCLGFYDPRSGARKLADKLLPPGTRRRKFAKKLLPKGSLRWRFCKQIYYIFKPQYRPKKEVDIEDTVEEDED